jgi:UDP-GlcNAc:undecaprenyl-phosphate GlcNAc-1-phosphate transferase
VHSYLIAAGITLLLLYSLAPLANRIGLVDRPGGRRSHERSTPLIGGIAMFCGFLGAVLTAEIPLGEWRALFAASAVLIVVGVLDDFKELSAKVRFGAQIGAALIMTLWGGVVVTDLGNLLGTGEIPLGIWAIPFTVFGTVGVINALNMIDGLDGLAGGLAVLVLGALAAVAGLAGYRGDATILALLTVVVGTFLTRNLRLPGRRHAAVFMGDAGSMFLGLVVAWFVIRLSQKPLELIQPATALWLFALPLLDTVAIMVRRIAKGRSPFAADREHFHHILLLAGFSVGQAVLTMHIIAALCLGVGLLATHLDFSEALLFYGFVALFGLYYVGMMHAWKVMRVLRSAHDAMSH